MINKEFEQQAVMLYKPTEKVVGLVRGIAEAIDGWKRSEIFFPFPIPLADGRDYDVFKVERTDDHAAFLVHWDGGGYASAYMLDEGRLERLEKAVKAYIKFLETSI